LAPCAEGFNSPAVHPQYNLHSKRRIVKFATFAITPGSAQITAKNASAVSDVMAITYSVIFWQPAVIWALPGVIKQISQSHRTYLRTYSL
jgi:hypothetical protein